MILSFVSQHQRLSEHSLMV